MSNCGRNNNVDSHSGWHTLKHTIVRSQLGYLQKPARSKGARYYLSVSIAC